MLKNVKAFIKSVPILGPCLVHISREPFKGSVHYWDRRYRIGENSGSGSYGRLADFKAGFLNRFVDQHRIASVIEYGCGDGAQLRLARYPSYMGIDISPTAVEMCRAIFADDSSKHFLQANDVAADMQYDLSLSLDVIYHLVEDSIFEGYMKQLFEPARRFVIVYSSDMDQDWPARHVRHRQFTRWIAENKPEWVLQSFVKNAYPYDADDPENTSFADFHVFTHRI